MQFLIGVNTAITYLQSTDGIPVSPAWKTYTLQIQQQDPSNVWFVLTPASNAPDITSLFIANL